VIFNLQFDQSGLHVFRQFPTGQPDLLKLFLLRLQLFTKYEDEVLNLAEEAFVFMKCIALAFLEILARRSLLEEETVKDYSLLISLCSRIFCQAPGESEAGNLDFSVVKRCLLHHLRENETLMSSSFWQSYFEHKNINRPRSASTFLKMKSLKISDTMVFYYYILFGNIKTASDFIEECIPRHASSYNLVKGFVKLQIGEVIYSISHRFKKPRRLQTLPVQALRLPMVLALVFAHRLLPLRDLIKLLHLDKFSSDYLKLPLFRFMLLKSVIPHQQRMLLWVKYCHHQLRTQYSKAYPNPQDLVNHAHHGPHDCQPNGPINGTKNGSSPHCFLELNPSPNDLNSPLPDQPLVRRPSYSKETKHQIEIDVVRTKRWKGEEYQERLKSLLFRFFERCGFRKEYFQGFNYIVSFLADVFPNDDDCLVIADYLSHSLLLVP